MSREYVTITTNIICPKCKTKFNNSKILSDEVECPKCKFICYNDEIYEDDELPSIRNKNKQDFN